MNTLQLTAELATLESITKVADLDRFIRRYAKKSNYVSMGSEDKFMEYRYPYRILSSALYKHSQISTSKLPDFIITYHNVIGVALFNYIFAVPVARCDYDMFVRIFTDTSSLSARNRISTLSSFSELVQDRPNPIKNLTINPDLFGYDLYIGNMSTIFDHGRSDTTVTTIFYLEYILRHLSNPDKSKYLFLNQMLDELYIKEVNQKYLDNIEHQVTNTLETLAKVRSRLGI